MLGVRTWRWVRVYPIRRPPIETNTRQIHAIVAENRTSSEPNRFLADCITNTLSRLRVPDRIFADHNRMAEARVRERAQRPGGDAGRELKMATILRNPKIFLRFVKKLPHF